MASVDSLKGAIGKQLYTEQLTALAGALASWRRNPTVRLMDAAKDKGRILDFVKGLRLSAQVAYIVRSIVSSQPDIEVSWGHLVDSKGNSCSAECDVIIHRKGHIQRWNGGESPIMDFKFVHCESAIAVISCKSLAKSIDKKYPTEIAKYGVENVLLVAECCPPKKVGSLSQKAADSGYSGFYYLYLYDEKSFADTRDENNYVRFVEDLLRLTTPSRKKATPTKAKRKKKSAKK